MTSRRSRLARFLALWVLVVAGILAANAVFATVFNYALDHPAQAPYIGAVILIAVSGASAWLISSEWSERE